jgi:threonine/homoserine/homoserine lactone efflux protein
VFFTAGGKDAVPTISGDSVVEEPIYPMPDLSTLPLFITASVALLILPGPAMLYTVTRSIDQGRAAGLVSALGVETGTLFHAAAAALGVSAVLVSSALAFTAIKFLGAGYLIYLGIQKILDTRNPAAVRVVKRQRLSHIFYQGVLVNLTNPKTALFFFAFLPQFVNPASGSAAVQMLVLGCIYVALGIINYSLWALLAGTLGSWLKGNVQHRRSPRFLAGGVYIALGVTTALAAPSHR